MKMTPIKGAAMTTPILEKIAQEVQENPVILYMKGTPQAPQCGFSSLVCQVLSRLGVSFTARDVLVDPELRQGIKEFTQWPTIPQLYIQGEFIGGCDIVREMYESGELKTLLQEKGLCHETKI
jgi:monothiol glutaredoxin